jgi:fructose-specific phosphotransferase system component IIB
MIMKKELTTRKIGNAIGVIFPKDFDLDESMRILATKNDTTITLDLYNARLKKAQKLIENDFAQIEQEKFVTDANLKSKFGKYGWGKNR